MSLYEEILNELGILNEGIATKEETIKTAIKEMKRLRLTYDDGKKHIAKNGKEIRRGKNFRNLCPIALGLNKKGNVVLRCYQSYGSSKRGFNRATNDSASNPLTGIPSFKRDKPY